MNLTMCSTPFIYKGCGKLHAHCENMEGSDAVDENFDRDILGPTLNDILSYNNLTEENLKKGCPPEVTLKIAEELSEWNLLGRYLKIPKQDLTAINRQYDTEARRKVAMFDKWHEKGGSNATYLRLADALYQHGRKDLVELLCKIVKKTYTNTEEIDKNQVQTCMYAILHDLASLCMFSNLQVHSVRLKL